MYHLHLHRVDTQLCCSRDGKTWERVGERELFLPTGAHGDFDGYWAVPTFNPPIRRDGQLLIYYGGRAEPHPQPGFSIVGPGWSGAFGLATLREDGFASLDATGTEGFLETQPLALSAARSHIGLNVCPFDDRPGRAPLRVEMEVLAADGTPLQGYVIDGAAPAQVWTDVAMAEALPDVVRLRLRLHNARLYAFRVC
jgi:hypothetical protein